MVCYSKHANTRKSYLFSFLFINCKSGCTNHSVYGTGCDTGCPINVKIAIATYKTELVLHADKGGKGTLVKQVQICNHLNQLIRLVKFDHLLTISFSPFGDPSVHLPIYHFLKSLFIRPYVG